MINTTHFTSNPVRYVQFEDFTQKKGISLNTIQIWYNQIILNSKENKQKLIEEDKDFAIQTFNRFNDEEGLNLIKN